MRLTLWARDAGHARELEAKRVNTRYLPELELPKSVRVTSNLDEATFGCEVLFFAIPLQELREFVITHQEQLPSAIWIGTAKGIEAASGKFEHEILERKC